MPFRKDGLFKTTFLLTKNKTVIMATNNNETKVVCPVCGTEFDVLSQHEHKEKNVTVLGLDSGMGTIALPVAKRGEALQEAGIDTSKYFSINVPGGEPMMMKKTDDGKAVPVSADDPIVQAILGGGTVPNRRLFRRWVMSQVFHGLQYKTRCCGNGFSGWLKQHGYVYQWEMFIEELHVQAKLYTRDTENFKARNRWFNADLAVKMAEDYIRQLRIDATRRPQHRCKGVPYVTVGHTHYFVADIEKKLILPLQQLAVGISHANTPQALEERVRIFWQKAPVQQWSYTQCAEWKDAYKGMGAYATMQNLLRFHGCRWPKDNDFWRHRHMDDLDKLELAAKCYEGEGWRLFGLMKQMIEYNGIDIEKKQKQWSEAKKK